jgi:hypothetical protein
LRPSPLRQRGHIAAANRVHHDNVGITFMASVMFSTYLDAGSRPDSEFDTMLKGAWILPAVMLFVLIVAAVPTVVFAADDPFGRSMNTYFKDLPGVVPEEQRVKESEYRCETGVGYVTRPHRGFRDSILDDLPTQVYRCESPNGTTYTGTRMPTTQWAPGISPHHLPDPNQRLRR